MGEQLHRIVEVEWEDSAGSHGWQSTDEIPDPHIITSLGYVIRDDDEAFTVTESLNHGKELPNAILKKYGCTMTIPRSAIRKVTELQAKPKANGKRRR